MKNTFQTGTRQGCCSRNTWKRRYKGTVRS